MANLTTKKNESKKKEINNEEFSQKLKKTSDEVVEKIKWLKKKFNGVDPVTKKKIAIVIGSAVASLTLLSGLSKRKSKKNNLK